MNKGDYISATVSREVFEKMDMHNKCITLFHFGREIGIKESGGGRWQLWLVESNDATPYWVEVYSRIGSLKPISAYLISEEDATDYEKIKHE